MPAIKHSDKSIRQQWTAYGVGVLCLLVVTALGIYDRYDGVKIQEQERLTSASFVVQATMQRNLSAINLSLGNVLAEIAKGVQGDALSEQLRIIDEAMPMMHSIIVVDASGRIRAASLAEIRKLDSDFSGREYVRAPKMHPNARMLYITAPFKTVLNSYTVAVTRMITGPNGEFAGVVSALIDPQYFDSVLNSALYAPDMVAALVDGSGIIFMTAPSGRNDLNGHNLAGQGDFFLQHQASGRNANVYSGYADLIDNDGMLAIHTVLPTAFPVSSALGVAIARPQRGIFSTWRHDLVIVATATLFIFLAAALGLHHFQRRYRHFLAQEALSYSRLQRAANVFTYAREGIVITDAHADIVDVNAAFTQITGYAREEALGRNPRFLQSDCQDHSFFVAMWHDLATHGYWGGEIWNKRKNGQTYIQNMDISAVRDDAGVVQQYVALFSDITASKAHQSELERVAHYDSLTGFPNRLLLGDRLRQAVAQSQRRSTSLAVVFLDLDNLKLVNDIYGHAAGDLVLTTVCGRMSEALREGDTLARLGGDEFVAVLTDLGQTADCIPIIERLLGAASSPVDWSVDAEEGAANPHFSLQVSASIGVTFYPQDPVDADGLLRHADQAMYVAKQAGKNRYHLFDIASDVAIQNLHGELKRIGEAIAKDEFVLYYQPKVNMRTGQVTGVEALIRWLHPERGLLAPAAFLPLIEAHPISITLGEWVIGTALTQIDTWRGQGCELPVSVNIGALQLQQPDFPARLGQLLAEHPSVNPKNLRLEILETSALEDIEKVSGCMRACQALGVSFALDDFGTGYSSLTYLKHLPAEMLKIDQSFIRNMTEQPDDLAIVKGVIGLASAFRRKVIAEGVETRAHGDLLLSIGCELAQGYGVARPMPAHEVPAWTARWESEAVWTA